MKEEWNKYYKAITSKKQKEKSYKSFVKYCDMLEMVNGEPLSDYYGCSTCVTYKIYGLVLTTQYNHVKRQIETLQRAIDRLEQNNDEFVCFDIDKERKFITITFIHKKDKSVNTVSINAYTNFVKGRTKFYNKLEENKHVLLTPYIGNDKKVLIDFKCGHIPTEITPNAYMSGQRCSICSHHMIIPYVNDFYSIHSELLEYFDNPTDVIGVSQNEENKFLLRCPLCHKGTKWMALENFVRNGFSCPYCSNKTSYFNRFMTFLLEELNEDFESEKRFEWCKFITYNGKDISFGIYDFVLKQRKLIIEMDGGFHYRDNIMSNKSKEEIQYIDIQKDVLAEQHGYCCIRINCCYDNMNTRFQNFIDNLYKSKFIEYFDISNIDLSKIHEKCLENDIQKASSYWMRGYGITEIAELMMLSKSTIRNYLIIGVDVGWCNYTSAKAKSRSYGYKLKVLQGNKLVGLFESKQIASTILREKYNMPFDADMIAKNINGKTSNYKGLNFIKINNEEYRKLLNEEIHEAVFI